MQYGSWLFDNGFDRFFDQLIYESATVVERRIVEAHLLGNIFGEAQASPALAKNSGAGFLAVFPAEFMCQLFRYAFLEHHNSKSAQEAFRFFQRNGCANFSQVFIHLIALSLSEAATLGVRFASQS